MTELRALPRAGRAARRTGSGPPTPTAPHLLQPAGRAAGSRCGTTVEVSDGLVGRRPARRARRGLALGADRRGLAGHRPRPQRDRAARAASRSCAGRWSTGAARSSATSCSATAACSTAFPPEELLALGAGRPCGSRLDGDVAARARRDARRAPARGRARARARAGAGGGRVRARARRLRGRARRCSSSAGSSRSRVAAATTRRCAR